MALPASHFDNSGMGAVRRRETVDGLNDVARRVDYLYRSSDISENEYYEVTGLLEELFAILDSEHEYLEEIVSREPGD